MSVKRFVAPDMRRALDLVRQEMGPNAIILSSQKTKDGVEVVTSSETDMPTRGVDAREEFSAKFDRELDQPLASDQAWHLHSSMKKAAEDHGAFKFSQDAQASAQHLAKEIEAARERMIAAKSGEGLSDEAKLSDSRVSFGEAFNEQQLTYQHGKASRTAQQPAVKETQETEQYSQELKNLQAQIDEMKKAHEVQLQKEREKHEAERVSSLQEDIADMRLLLEQQLRSARDYYSPRPVDSERQSKVRAIRHESVHAETVQSNLRGMGLPLTLVDKLSQDIPAGKHLNVAWRETLAKLANSVSVDDTDCVNLGGTFAFVGPTGVGKTTTIAKLAARYVLEHGPGKVALITTDTYRVGAQDQLRSLGRILNVPVRVVDSEQHLSNVLKNLSAFPLILIDTAGFRQGDPHLREQDMMINACPQIQRVVVLSCNSQYQTLKASLHAYSDKNTRGCILTKLDETASLGEAIGAAIQRKLPLLYTTHGQDVPQDIAVASAYKLVTEAVKVYKHQTMTAEESANESVIG